MYDSPQDLQAAAAQSKLTRDAFMSKYGGAPQPATQPTTQPATQPTAQPATQPATQPTAQSTITDPDLAQAASESEATRKSFAEKYPSQVSTPDSGVHDASDKQSMLGSLMLGGHIGMDELAARVTQAGVKLGELTGYMPKGTGAEFTRQFNKKYLKNPHYLAAQRQHPIATGAGELAGSTAPLLSVPYGLAGKAVTAGAGAVADIAPVAAKVATKAAPWLARGAESALMGLSQYDPSGKQAGQQAGLGAAIGMLVPPALRKVAEKIGTAIEPAAAAAARKFGIGLSPYPKLERGLSKVPGAGIKKVIEQRGAAVAKKGEEIAKKIIGEAGGKSGIAPDGQETGYAKHFTGALLRQYRAAKNTVSMFKEFANKESDKITTKTGMLVKPLGMKVAASNEIASQKALAPEFRDKDFIDDLSKHESAAPMTYRAADALKKQLDDKIQGLKNPLSSVKSNKERVYVGMRSGLKDDINAFVDEVGLGFKHIHNSANRIYETNVAPFKKAPYSKLLRGDMNSGQFISKFIKPAREVAGGEQPEDVHKLLSLMPESNSKARLSMRAAVLSRALEHAELPGGGINGRKFADEAMKVSKATGGVFSKEQRDTIKGYQILTHHLEKYQPSVTDMSKLQRATGRLAHLGSIAGGVGLALFHPYVVGAAYGSALGVSKLFTTKVGQSLLKNVARLGIKAGSKKLNPLVQKGMSLILTKEAVNRLGG